MAEPISFARSADGHAIAYSASGAGPALVHVRPWITHLELMWAEPSFRRFIDGLGDVCTVVRYDGRGNGLSERRVPPPTLEDLGRDLAAVIDALGDERVHLWGSSFGGPVAIAYAASRPEQVDRLILEGSFATLRHELTATERGTMVEVGRLLQTSPEVAATAISYITDPTPNTRHERRVARLMESIEPEMLSHLYNLAGRIDVRSLLAQISAPTLVMHRPGSRVFPFSCARTLAAGIPGAQLVALDGAEHNPWEGDHAAALSAMRTFLGGRPARAPATVTLLFSDLVASTELLQRLGDTAGAKIFREHTELLRRAVDHHGGNVVKRLGDGILATFPSASAAVHCALAVRTELHARNSSAPTAVQVRIDLAAGEPIPDDDDLLGSVVHLAARLCSAAHPNEILVTEAVCELVNAKGFRFDPARMVQLKGFSHPVRVWPVDSAPG